MSVQALSCAFAIRGISPSEKLVLLALANFANENMRCWPSQDRLAADTELSPRTVWAALKSLEGTGLISRASRTRQDGTRSTDFFTLNLSLQVASEPLANLAKTTRKSCENHSQILQEPVATVATLTTFEPSASKNRQIVEGGASAPPKRSSRHVPADWSPSGADLGIGRDEGFSPGELERELAMFRDHQFRDAHSDWSKAFRNWIRRSAKNRPRHERPNTPDAKRTAREANLARALAGLDAVADGFG